MNVFCLPTMKRAMQIARDGIVVSLFVVFTSQAVATDRRYPVKWEWSHTQMREIERLSAKCKKTLGSDFPVLRPPNWELDGGSIVIRSTVSGEVAAEGFLHAQQAIKMFPEVLKLPQSSTRPKKVRFVITIHGKATSMSAVAPDSQPNRGYSRLSQQDDGTSLAEVHLLSDWDIHPGAGNNLTECIDVGVMQGHLARLILEMWSPDRPFPPFFAKGCAAYYETFDVYKKKLLVRGISRPECKAALVDAIVDDKILRPSLSDMLQISTDEFAKDENLNAGLSNHFIQFMMEKSERRAFVLRALAHMKGGGKIEPKVVATLEKDWHHHLYYTLANSRLVLHSDLQTEAELPGAAGIGKLSAYGNKPELTLIPSKGSVHDLAWFNEKARTIHILRCDADGGKIDEFSPVFIKQARALLGATRLPGDKGYAVGYSHDNSHGDMGSEYWVAGFDLKGEQLFNTLIFGDKNLKELKSKGRPGGAGTARMVYNEQAKNIGFYLSHTMLWGDGVRHQAGFVGFIDEKGKRLPGGNGWFYSHNFDQRLIVAGGDFYALAHGDAYPRALGFSRWAGSGGKRLASKTYHTIPGESGDNTTHCQTGGLVALSARRFAVVFATSNEREGHDICVKIIDSSGNTTKEKWLTQHVKGANSAYPRIARYADNIFLAWHDSDRRGLQHIVLNQSLEPVVPQSNIEGVKISPYDELHNLDDGAIVWVVPQGKNRARIYRIDQPKVLAKKLIERNAPPKSD